MRTLRTLPSHPSCVSSWPTWPRPPGASTTTWPWTSPGSGRRCSTRSKRRLTPVREETVQSPRVRLNEDQHSTLCYQQSLSLGCDHSSASYSDPSSMSASGSSPLSSSRSRSRIDSDSSGSSSPQSDESSASAQSYSRNLNSNRNQYLNYYTSKLFTSYTEISYHSNLSGVWNRNGKVHFTLESGARYELRETDIQRAFSKHGMVMRVKLYLRSRRGLDGYVGT